MTLSMTPQAIERRRHRANARLRAAAAGEALPPSKPTKADRAVAMHRVDAEYARSAAPATRRCCTRCKTPFGICGNKGCACHG